MTLYKKPLFFILISSLVIGLSSCVSSRKYQAALDANQRLEMTNDDLRLETAQANAKFEQREVEMNTQLEVDYLKTVKEVDRLQKLLASAQKAIDLREASLKELHSELYDELSPLFPGEVYIENEDGKIKVTFSDRIFFEKGEDDIQEDGMNALKNFSSLLSQHPELDIQVVGHTDSIPVVSAPYADNWELSVERATTVVRVLESNGLNPERITASGRSMYQPATSNKTAKGRELNRRTEILLVPDFEKDIYDFLLSSK